MEGLEHGFSPDDGETLMDSALGAYGNFQAGLNENGLDTAISLLEASVERTDEQHPEMSMRLNNLFAMLRERHRITGRVEDISRAAEVGQVALSVLPEGDAERPSWLSALAVVKWKLYELQGSSNLLDDAIMSFESLTHSTPQHDPKLPSRLMNLSLALIDRFRLHTERQDIDNAIRHATAAVDMTPETSPEHPRMSLNLGRVIISRFEAYGDESDLDIAMAATRRAVENARENDPYYLMYLSNLATMLSQRYTRLGKSEDFDEAVRVIQPIMENVSTSGLETATFRTAMADMSDHRYERTGELCWLEDAIQKRQESIEQTPVDSPVRLGRLNNLAIDLLKRQGRKGSRKDLEQAINILRDIIDFVPSDGVELPVMLFNLSNALNVKYEYSGELRLLDESIKYSRTLADAVLNKDTQNPGRLAALATKLIARYRRFRDRRDVVEALKLLKKELRLYPDHPDRAGWLAELAVAIEASDLDAEGSNELHETLTLLEKEIQSSKYQPLDLPMRLAALANRLSRSFEKSKSLEHLNKAVQYAEHAVELTPDDSPELGTLKNNLGYLLELRYKNSNSGRDLKQAINCFIGAWNCESSIPFHRVMAAGRGIRLLGLSSNFESGSELAKEVVDFLPTLSSGVVDFDDRQYTISTYSGIAADTCAMLLALGQKIEALEYLQKGRTAILRELQHSRAISQLRKHDETLATKFEILRNEVNTPLRGIEDPVIRAQAVEKRKEATRELQSIIKNDIHNIPGLSLFQSGQTVEDLQKCAAQGPIIMVNVSDIRSDAIIVTSAKVCTLNLPLLEAKELQSLLGKQWNGLRNELGAGNKKYRSFLSWLWKNGLRGIMEEIERILEGSHSAETLPRVWWIGSGHASALPFHAAGEHQPSSTDNVLSKVISSYASSLHFLTHSPERRTNAPPPLDRVLIATMTSTPGFPDLPKVQGEGRLVKGLFGLQVQTEELEEGPTAKQVEEAIQSCSIAHLACHGYVDSLDLSKSGLVFQKSGPTGTPEQDILTLRQLVDLNLQGAKIAYLSACSTAENKLAELADESLTVVSGFQIAGFRHVIGCLWASFDDVCKDVSEMFYKSILEGGSNQWDDRVIAIALHKAVLRVRDQYPRQPLLWAQFVHFGS